MNSYFLSGVHTASSVLILLTDKTVKTGSRKNSLTVTEARFNLELGYTSINFIGHIKKFPVNDKITTNNYIIMHG